MTDKKKRIYAVVMILGAVALVLDRAVLSDGPSVPAPAGAQPATRPVPAPPPATAPPARSFPIPELHFPRDLPSVDLTTGVRDWFEPPMRRGSQGSSGEQNPAGASLAATVATRARDFLANHRLGGVVLNGSRTIAIVDDEWIVVGQEMDHCRLADVASNTATFTCGDGDAVLKLFDRDPSPSR